MMREGKWLLGFRDDEFFLPGCFSTCTVTPPSSSRNPGSDPGYPGSNRNKFKLRDDEKGKVVVRIPG